MIFVLNYLAAGVLVVAITTWLATWYSGDLGSDPWFYPRWALLWPVTLCVLICFTAILAASAAWGLIRKGSKLWSTCSE